MILLLLALLGIAGATNDSASIPQQVHIVLGDASSPLVVSWISFEEYDPKIYSVVKYGYNNDSDSWTMSATGDPYPFQGLEPPTRIIHNVPLEGLIPENNCETIQKLKKKKGNSLYYKCGNSNGTYREEIFVTRVPDFMEANTNSNATKTIRIASYGDFGLPEDNPDINISVYEVLYDYMMNNKLDFVLHMGDIAYDLNINNGTVGDLFLNGIEPVSSRIPYMTGIGCHERDDRWVVFNNVSYGQYLNRFSGLLNIMQYSQSTSLHYYSFNVHNIHIIKINFPKFVVVVVVVVVVVLKGVDRTETPWIIVFGHRSMYCTKIVEGTYECTRECEYLKNGVIDPNTLERSWALEPLFYQYHVDLYLSGHTHHYERTYPVFNNVTTQFDYQSPDATVYVVNGIAGVTSFDPFRTNIPLWSAYRDTELRTMFGHIQVFNQSVLTYEAVDYQGNIFDSFTIVK
ncbi:hypothetical protein RFI_28070 [Reticulomyxa filosa]|uniref:Purple acid phosphatase n=1 Tax=Reticulomyxa filosa TaxID=46433 RepID=X6M5W6_RETFI|nr:hypothetical protein RFI_28070 [Reticulomyxa filosa]|eukprot:ETO09319.1 hypothetical protein RFI_28070 [Reticulomyxa filosa]